MSIAQLRADGESFPKGMQELTTAELGEVSGGNLLVFVGIGLLITGAIFLAGVGQGVYDVNHGR